MEEISKMKNNNFDVDKQVEVALDKLEVMNKTNFFFISVGGSFALMYLGKYIVDQESTKLEAHTYSSNEFAQCPPTKLNEKSIVLLCSNSDKTSETVKTASVANYRIATTITITNQQESKITNNCDVNLRYKSEE